MRPRLITRSHYQVDEPAYLVALVLECTSPVRGEYRERVALKLANLIRSWGKKFNVAAAGYAIDFARGLRLLTDNLVWTELGMLIRLVFGGVNRPGINDDSLAERTLLFRIYLDGDGAALAFLACTALQRQQLPPPNQSWNDLANEMTQRVFEQYLELASEPSERATLRNVLETRRRCPFSGKSGTHQVFIHVQSLYRMGLLAREGLKQDRLYGVPTGAHRQRLQLVSEILPNVRALEQKIEEVGCIGVATDVFRGAQGESISHLRPPSAEDIFNGIVENYQSLMSLGLAVCPLRPLLEAIIIRQMTSGSYVTRYSEALKLLQEFQRLYPRKIRFHVDYIGTPAYIKIADVY